MTTIAVIAKGVTGGENVVLSGQSRLAPGTRVADERRQSRARRQAASTASPRMSISTPFIRRPIATSLLTAAVFLAGLVAFPLLPVAPLPNVEFPDAGGVGELSRRQSRDDGLHRRDAAGNRVRPDAAWPGADDLDQRAGKHADHAAVRPQHRHQVRSHHGAGGDQRRAGLAAEGDAEPADVPRDQSVRRADPDPVDAVGSGADHRGGRLRGEPGRAADCRSFRAWDRCWWADSRRRRSACRSIRPGSPRWA